MTRALPFTQASIIRAIKAASKAGLRVAAIRPDGTIVVDNASTEFEEIRKTTNELSKWEDVKA